MSDPLTIDKYDRLLIGEFIRRHHPRLAHEFTLYGVGSRNGILLQMPESINENFRDLIGLIARSHGMELRDTFKYLRDKYDEELTQPYGIHVIYLMVLLRISDYFQIDSNRTDSFLLKTKSFSSPFSELEHSKHLSIEFIQTSKKDPETFWAHAAPKSSTLFLKLKELFHSIQYELDISWAVLGEIYGKEIEINRPQIRYRRIKSNIDNNSIYFDRAPYVADKISFTTDTNLPKLLVGPLYGHNPTFGVRELIQNAVDACKEQELNKEELKDNYIPLVEVLIEENKEGIYFKITDNGKGMSVFEIKNYFLKVGSSFRKSLDWLRKYTDTENRPLITRNGRFGIGVLAAFLLGDKIVVSTRSTSDSVGYQFTAQIDDDQIEVEKITDLDFGTSVRIKISKYTLEQLLHPGSMNDTYLPKWDGWYFSNPNIVRYKLDIDYDKLRNKTDYKNQGIWYNKEINIPSDTEFSNNKWRIFSTEDYEKIQWAYELWSIGDNIWYRSNIICNGIVIPKKYELHTEIIKSSPGLIIYDKNSTLNINLSRNEIDGYLSFEDTLVREIYKDIIAKLLTEYTEGPKTSKNFFNKRNTFFHPSFHESTQNGATHHEIPILYSAKGYSLFYSFFTKKLSNKKIIDIILSDTKITNKFFKWSSKDSENYFFSIKSVTPINENSTSGVNYFLSALNNSENSSSIHERSSLVCMHTHLYKKIFNSKNKVRKGYKESIKILSADNEWTMYSYAYQENFSETIDLSLIKEYSICFSVSHMYDRHRYNSTHDIFDELLEKYIGKDVVIPYNIHDRMTLYKDAFYDLEPFIRIYAPDLYV